MYVDKEVAKRIIDDKNKRMVDKVCFNSLFFGTDYKLEEVMA